MHKGFSQKRIALPYNAHFCFCKCCKHSNTTSKRRSRNKRWIYNKYRRQQRRLKKKAIESFLFENTDDPSFFE